MVTRFEKKFPKRKVIEMAGTASKHDRKKGDGDAPALKVDMHTFRDAARDEYRHEEKQAIKKLSTQRQERAGIKREIGERAAEIEGPTHLLSKNADHYNRLNDGLFGLESDVTTEFAELNEAQKETEEELSRFNDSFEVPEKHRDEKSVARPIASIAAVATVKIMIDTFLLQGENTLGGAVQAVPIATAFAFVTVSLAVFSGRQIAYLRGTYPAIRQAIASIAVPFGALAIVATNIYLAAARKAIAIGQMESIPSVIRQILSKDILTALGPVEVAILASGLLAASIVVHEVYRMEPYPGQAKLFRRIQQIKDTKKSVRVSFGKDSTNISKENIVNYENLIEKFYDCAQEYNQSLNESQKILGSLRLKRERISSAFERTFLIYRKYYNPEGARNLDMNGSSWNPFPEDGAGTGAPWEMTELENSVERDASELEQVKADVTKLVQSARFFCREIQRITREVQTRVDERFSGNGPAPTPEPSGSDSAKRLVACD